MVGADWAPATRELKKYRQDDLIIAAFKGVMMVEVRLDDWNKSEMVEAGIYTDVVPVFKMMDENAECYGDTITGAIWGEYDTPEAMHVPLKLFFDGNTELEIKAKIVKK